MAKKRIFKNFFSRMKKNAQKEKMKNKNTCDCNIMCCKSTGVGFWGYGSILAMIISYTGGSSLFWTLVDGILSWIYIIIRLFRDLNFF